MNHVTHRYVFWLGLIAAQPNFAQAANTYPARPVRIVVPTGAGGVTDVVARVIALRLGERLGQQVIVDNRPGAGGVTGTQIVATAAPDGHTLLMVFPSHAFNPSLVAKLPYDSVKSFAPISLTSSVAPAIVVSGNSPARTVQDFINLAKEKPGSLNFGSVGSGSLAHLSGELFRAMAGIRVTQVFYKGAPQVMPEPDKKSRNEEVDFHGQTRTNATHVSTTDPRGASHAQRPR